MKGKHILAGVVFAASGCFTAVASAAIIPSWNWGTDGGFVDGAGSCSNGGEAACDLTYDNTTGVTTSGIAGTSSVMSWGTPVDGEQSGLQVVNGASGTGGYDAALLGSAAVPIPAFEQITTNGGWTNTGAAVHYNNVITAAGGYMDASALTLSFDLFIPPATPVLGDVANLNVELNETLNTDGGPCPDGNPHGTFCDDIFTIDPLAGPVIFSVGGQQYQLSFRYFAGDGAIVDTSGDDIRVFTSEDAPGTAVLFTQARIDAIPVPGVLALMGAGLVLLGWRVRKIT